MLIRSQNKEKIINLNAVPGFTYEETHDYRRGKENNTNHEICIDYGGLNESIGIYSTKEKAIKVLDMIETAYKKTTGLEHEFHANILFCVPRAVVFQMPQDCEVQT